MSAATVGLTVADSELFFSQAQVFIRFYEQGEDSCGICCGIRTAGLP